MPRFFVGELTPLTVIYGEDAKHISKSLRMTAGETLTLCDGNGQEADGVIESLNTCKYFIVITTKPQEISQFIMTALHHGVTTGKAVGEYTHEERTMIHTVCKRAEAVRLRERIREIDPKAFTIITTSSEIIGRGFRGV